MGLINKVLKKESLEGFTRETCEQIAANAPLTIAAAKQTIDMLLDAPSAEHRARIDALIETCFDSDDYKEGRRAFMEKRKARFTGK